MVQPVQIGSRGQRRELGNLIDDDIARRALDGDPAASPQKSGDREPLRQMQPTQPRVVVMPLI